MNDIKALEEKLAAMTPEQRAMISRSVTKYTSGKKGIPNSGPQTAAYFSQADVLLFGGKPGGGKSSLGCLLALNEHHRSLIVRAAFTDLEGMIDTAKKIVGDDSNFIGGSRPKYKKQDGGVIHFMGMPEDGGIGGMQGVDHDFIYVDEAAQAQEAQIRLIMGWLRTDKPGQRTRVVFGSNPPLDATGDWLVSYFPCWLDPRHPNPAKPGELRYFLPDPDGGADRECEKDDFIVMHGLTIRPQSRTFIPSDLLDNPYYDPEVYAKQLAGMDPRARDIIMSGNFMLERPADLWQLISTGSVKDAQARWSGNRPARIPMSCLGVDVAQGGADFSVVASRYDYWYDELLVVPGKQTPEGEDIAAMVVKVRRDRADVVMDMGGGYGGSPKVHLKDNGIDVISFKGALESHAQSEDKQLHFVSQRAEIWWKFKEAIEAKDSMICLPQDRDLATQLTAPTYRTIRRNKRLCVDIEAKEKTKKRVGCDLDKADAVLMAWWKGPKGVAPQHPRRTAPSGRRGGTVKANLGHSKRKGQRR